jgi:hypothetical protein
MPLEVSVPDFSGRYLIFAAKLPKKSAADSLPLDAAAWPQQLMS